MSDATLTSNENPFKALAKEFLKENPDMTVGDAVYIKTFAMWLDRRSQREPNSKPRCQICGTHEVEQTQTCHNSGCESYARGVTIYEGWRTHETLTGCSECGAKWQLDHDQYCQSNRHRPGETGGGLAQKASP